jgi:hypothetical protein
MQGCGEHLIHFDIVYGAKGGHTELQNGEERPDLFKQILKIEPDQQKVEDKLPTKLLKACATMKLKAEKRDKRKRLGKNKWEQEINDLDLVKFQHTSDATQCIMGKFHRP